MVYCRLRDDLSLPAGVFMPVLLFIVFIDLVGFGIVIPLLPFYAEHFGASPATVTLVLASYSAAQFATAPFMGQFSDRFGRRRIILLSLIGSAAGYALMALADTLLMLILARVLAGAMAGNIAAAQAYIADVTTPENRARGMGMFGAAFGMGFIAGPFLGGTLAGIGSDGVNFALPPLAASGTSMIAAVLAFFYLQEPVREAARATPDETILGRWFGPIAAALSRPGLAALVTVFFLVVFAFSGLETTFALWAERQLSWGPVEVGYMFAGVGVVAVIVQGGLIGPLTRRLGEDRVLLTGVISLAAGFVLLPVASNLAAVMLAMALLAAGFGLANPSLHSLVSRHADQARQGAALGVAQSAASLARIFGPIAAGIFFTFGGRALPYFASAAILIGVGVALWRRNRQSVLNSQKNP